MSPLTKGLAVDRIREQRHARCKSIGTAKPTDSGLALGVAPKWLEKDHPLDYVERSEKAIGYLTDTMHRTTLSGGNSSPVGAAATSLKDATDAYVYCTMRCNDKEYLR